MGNEYDLGKFRENLNKIAEFLRESTGKCVFDIISFSSRSDRTKNFQNFFVRKICFPGRCPEMALGRIVERCSMAQKNFKMALPVIAGRILIPNSILNIGTKSFSSTIDL